MKGEIPATIQRGDTLGHPLHPGKRGTVSAVFSRCVIVHFPDATTGCLGLRRVRPGACAPRLPHTMRTILRTELAATYLVPRK